MVILCNPAMLNKTYDIYILIREASLIPSEGLFCVAITIDLLGPPKGVGGSLDATD